jgi:hypothetical protein
MQHPSWMQEEAYFDGDPLSEPGAVRLKAALTSAI